MGSASQTEWSRKGASSSSVPEDACLLLASSRICAITTLSMAGRVPRVSRLMALAMRFDDLIRSGQVTGYAELARLGHVTRARLSQIASLLGLAPDIQEAILFLPRTLRGRYPIQLWQLLPIAA